MAGGIDANARDSLEQLSVSAADPDSVKTHSMNVTGTLRSRLSRPDVVLLDYDTKGQFIRCPSVEQ